MTKREELNNRLLFFNPEITFDGTIGGIKLSMEVDAYNGHIMWNVEEGDGAAYFNSFEKALDYYLKAIGED